MMTTARFPTGPLKRSRSAPADGGKVSGGFEVQANIRLSSLADLPTHWRSQTFVRLPPRGHCLDAVDHLRGGARHAPNAVRLALGAPSSEQLETALRTLSGLLAAREDSIRPSKTIRRATGHSAIKPSPCRADLAHR